jgi:hypothetical protein
LGHRGECEDESGEEDFLHGRGSFEREKNGRGNDGNGGRGFRGIRRRR